MQQVIRSILSLEAKQRQCNEADLINAFKVSRENGKLFVETIIKAINQSIPQTSVEQGYKEGKADLQTKIIWDRGYNDAALRILKFLANEDN